MELPEPEKLRRWVPIRLYQNNGEMFLDWCYAGTLRFTRPFFNESIEQILSTPFGLLFRHQTPLGYLERLREEVPGVAPTGFIFHMSRCGSTLVSQMLASVDKNIVISEAPLFDWVLRLNGESSSRVERLKLIIDAYGRQRSDVEQYYFIKFDSWSTLEMDAILEAFPDVPWIFLYRNPIEVIVSQMSKRGSQMIPGAIGKFLPDMSLEEAITLAPEEYCAHVLKEFCEHALRHRHDRNGMFVNYDQLPGVMFPDILRHLDVSFENDEIERMTEVSKLDAKTPQMIFEPDSAKKRAAASEAAGRAAMLVDPLFDQLEKARLEK